MDCQRLPARVPLARAKVIETLQANFLSVAARALRQRGKKGTSWADGELDIAGLLPPIRPLSGAFQAGQWFRYKLCYSMWLSKAQIS